LSEIADSLERPVALQIRRLVYSDLPAVIGIERRSFVTPWSLAMFVLELTKPSGICLAVVDEDAVLEQDGKDIGEEQPQHENGDRYAEVGDEHRAHVGRRVPPVGRDDSQCHPDRDGEQQRVNSQLDRRRHALDDYLGNRLAGLDRLAEVAGGEVAQVQGELHGYRLVEPEALVEGGTGGRVRLLLEGRMTRVARDDARQDEHDGGHTEDDRNAREKSSD
jgi:hypothetical protein